MEQEIFVGLYGQQLYPGTLEILNLDSEQIAITEYVVNMRNKIKDFMNLANQNEVFSKSKQKLGA